jgi:hypothetical protein
VSQYPVIAAGDLITGALMRAMLPDYIVKAASTARASTTTFADDPELSIPVVAGEVCWLEFYLMFASLAAADLKTQWSVPAGTTGNRRVLGPGSAAADANADNIATRLGVHVAAGSTTYSGVRDSASNFFQVVETGLLTIGGTAGNVVMQWAQNTSNATATTLAAGSFVRKTRLS